MNDYWKGYLTGAITIFAFALTIGILDARGQLDPILDFLHFPK